jgi:hypothetical protein
MTCNQENCPEEQKELFGWFGKKYTAEQIVALLEKVKEFNCGAIDEYLNRHVEKVFEEWKKENN